MPERVVTCPRCAHRVGVREDGTLRNHRGDGREIFCRGAGMLVATEEPPPVADDPAVEVPDGPMVVMSFSLRPKHLAFIEARTEGKPQRRSQALQDILDTAMAFDVSARSAAR